MRNWKTSLAGVVVMVAGFVSASPQLFTKWAWAGPVANYVLVGGCSAIGLLARDQHKGPPNG